MADYLFCPRKKSTPRIDVRICQNKCPYKEECKEYLAYRRCSEEQSSVMDSRLIMPPFLQPMATEN
jgi:hypothetical protein